MTETEKFNIFKNEFMSYYEKLGLKHYEIEITEIEKSEEFRARTNIRSGVWQAVIDVNNEWLEEADEKLIRTTARHEAYELMLGNIRIHLEQYFSYDYADSLIHDVIRRLEK